MEKLKSTNSDAKIFVLAIPPEMHSSDDTFTAWDQIRRGQIVISNFLGVPYIDYTNLSDMFNTQDQTIQPNWSDFLHDGTHPEKEGHHIMATIIYSLLKGLV